MLVKQFRNSVDALADEIGCDGNGNIGSHKIRSQVIISCENSDDDFEFVELRPTGLPGCGCWDGIRIIIRKTSDTLEERTDDVSPEKEDT